MPIKTGNVPMREGKGMGGEVGGGGRRGLVNGKWQYSMYEHK